MYKWTHAFQCYSVVNCISSSKDPHVHKVSGQVHNSRVDIAEERISELDKRSKEIQNDSRQGMIWRRDGKSNMRLLEVQKNRRKKTAVHYFRR